MNDMVSIIPFRNIPFDIGRKVDLQLKTDITAYLLNKEDSSELEVSNLLKALSNDILCVFQIESQIRLYIYKYGIGVFTIEEVEKSYEKTNYGVEYCNDRKIAHKEYLTISNQLAKKMYKITEQIRLIAASGKNKLRISASKFWENNGFSYVMTVSCVSLSSGCCRYKKMNEHEKLNMHFLLEPSIVHAEDSLVYSTEYCDGINGVDIDLSTLEEPIDWIKSSDYSIYISWSAVLLYTTSSEKMTFSALEALEVDLQAMWLYTYCMYENLKNYNSTHKILVSKLRSDLYKFKRKYNEFKNLDDSSAPAYITRLREELIRTSGIDSYALKYIEYVEFCIIETETINAEKQKKYAWLNEILLFIIAFVQIAPMLYELMTGGYKDIQLAPVLLMIIIVVIAVVIIIAKD